MTANILHNGNEIVFEEYFPSGYYEKRDLEWEIEKYFNELQEDPFSMKTYGIYRDSEKIGICVLEKPKISTYAVLPFKFLFFIAMGVVFIPYYSLRNLFDWIFHGSKIEHAMVIIILTVVGSFIGMNMAEPYINQGFESLAQKVKIIHDARITMSKF